MSACTVLLIDRGLCASHQVAVLQRLGYRVVVTYVASERHAAHVLAADAAVCIGGPVSLQSRIRAEAILDAARVSGAEAVFPGSDELACNADFAAAVRRLGFLFIGPEASHIRALGTQSVLSAWSQPGQGCLSPVEQPARRVSVTLLGNGQGDVVALGARERRGSLFVESPVAGLDEATERELLAAALGLAKSLAYVSVGSVEFECDERTGHFEIIGAEPRFVVEDRAIEQRAGVDLVEWAMRIAQGVRQLPALDTPAGCSAIQALVRAVDPVNAMRPSRGFVTHLSLPSGCQVDTALQAGEHFDTREDSLVASLTVRGVGRLAAIELLNRALNALRVDGLETNLDLLRTSALGPHPLTGEDSHSVLEEVRRRSRSIEVLAPGTFSIVVEYPGRLGYWDVGIPPSGPMDDYSHRLANRIVGNESNDACLELTLKGPRLAFRCDALIALTGARMQATIDGRDAAFYEPLRIEAGQVLQLGAIEGPGARTYLAIRGGLDIAPYLGSRTSFTLGGFGGHCGRALRTGDVLHVAHPASTASPAAGACPADFELTEAWHLGVLYGPHAAPDFLTEGDVQVLFGTEYRVHFNSNRTGVRLVGPKPQWARPDGGEAGLHPSNIHDVPYAVGAIDFTGDMPILLGPDGPSLGGFVCPAVVVAAERWKLGQLRAGDRVRFVPMSDEAAVELARTRELTILDPKTISQPARETTPAVAQRTPVLARSGSPPERCEVVYRRSGDEYLLVEYGPMVLDIRLRLRVHALMQWLKRSRLPGLVDLTPGIRSLQVHFDNRQMTQRKLVDVLQRAEVELQDEPLAEVPSRIVHLPLSWDDPQTRLAIATYMRSVRADAPWCPSNIEFIRRINGLQSESDVYETVFATSYLVLCLGDVYLGAPDATPLDPRHRLVTTKYNPARTWTPENAVGIGGAYLCIYGMEGPGGYQFVGRTLQVYNRFRVTKAFNEGQPWLLRYFDQLRFYPVSAEELLDMRRDFLHGLREVRIEPARFCPQEYQRFLDDNAESIDSFRTKQRAAFEAERQAWLATGHLSSRFEGGPPVPPIAGMTAPRREVRASHG